MSRPPTERRTQGAFHPAPRAEGVRWGTVATSATLPRDHPGGDNGRDALVASAYGTWNNVEHRGHSIQRHAQRAFDGARSRQARPSRAPVPFDGARSRQARPSRAPMPFDGARTRQARPSRAAIPEETTGGTRLSRPPTERRTQGTSHSAPRATVATSATLPRRGRSMGHGRDKRDPPARPSRRRQTGGTRLSRPPTERGGRPRNPPGETSRDPPRGKNKARREHASGRTGLAEGGGFEPPIR